MQDIYKYMWAGLAQSLLLLATVWTVRGSNPIWARFSTLVQTALGHTQPPIQRVSLPRAKQPGRGVIYIPHLASRLKKE